MIDYDKECAACGSSEGELSAGNFGRRYHVHRVDCVAVLQSRLGAERLRREEVEAKLLAFHKSEEARRVAKTPEGTRSYITDDCDIDPARHRLDIFPGENGDWYVAIMPESDRFSRACVRITTSGSKRPLLQNAIADAYKALHSDAAERRALEQARNALADVALDANDEETDAIREDYEKDLRAVLRVPKDSPLTNEDLALFAPRTEDSTEPVPGLYRKFFVRRTDGSSEEGGKHEHCDYVVLDWKHDPFTSVAVEAYAEVCVHEYPELADDLNDRLAAMGRRVCLGPLNFLNDEAECKAPAVVPLGNGVWFCVEHAKQYGLGKEGAASLKRRMAKAGG